MTGDQSRDHSIAEHMNMSNSRHVIIYRHEAWYSQALCGANATTFPQCQAPLELAACFVYTLAKFFILYAQLPPTSLLFDLSFAGPWALKRHITVVL